MQQIRIVSGLSQRELIAKWDKTIERESFMTVRDLRRPSCFYGTREGSGVVLMHHLQNIRNNFATVFRGEIVETAQGSEIIGRFSKHIFTVVFMSVWLGMWTIGAVAALVTGHFVIGVIFVLTGALFARIAFGHKLSTKEMFISFMRELARDEENV